MIEINKIPKECCTPSKVLRLFSNASGQIIFSKDGFLYLRDRGVEIYKYLTDPQRHEVPADNDEMMSRWRNPHLFKYDQVYVKFTSSRKMAPTVFCDGDSYTLSFLYFHKNEKGETICAESFINDFRSEKMQEQIFDRKELEGFLYEMSDGVSGKYLFEWLCGIRFAQSTEEETRIDHNFLDLSDDSIIMLYNIYLGTASFHKKNVDFDSGKQNKTKKVTRVTGIDDVHEFSLNQFIYNPIMVEVAGDETYVYDFEIIYCGKNCYKVRRRRTKVTPELICEKI